MKSVKFEVKPFVVITLITSIWVQVSETFRYLILVVPSMNANASEIPETSILVLSIWVVWGTLLTALTVFLFWMHAYIFGNTIRTVFASSTISWVFFFVLFWIGISNMGLSKWSLLWITLPLSWLEMLIATFIASKLYRKHLKTQTT